MPKPVVYTRDDCCCEWDPANRWICTIPKSVPHATHEAWTGGWGMWSGNKKSKQEGVLRFTWPNKKAPPKPFDPDAPPPPRELDL